MGAILRVLIPFVGFVVVAGAVVVGVFDVEVVLGPVVDGAGSKAASTQYEYPTRSVPQLAGTDGFCRGLVLENWLSSSTESKRRTHLRKVSIVILFEETIEAHV